MESGSSTRQDRGPSKPWKDWDNRVTKIIEWDEDCQPVGENAHHLMSYLSNLARNGELFPLTMLSWRKADKDNLEKIWSSVKKISEINQVNPGKYCALPRTGRRSFPEIKRKRRLENKHVDLVNVWRATRGKCGSYNEEDGAAGTEKGELKSYPWKNEIMRSN